MATLNGTASSDNLDGGTDADVLNGLDGDDVLDGRSGIDQLFGGAGDDELVIADPVLAGELFDGGSGVDTLYVSVQSRVNSAGLVVALTNASLLSLERLKFGESGGLLSTADQRIQIGWQQLGNGLSSTAELIGHLGADTFIILADTPGTYEIPSFVKTRWNANDTVSLVATGSGDYMLSTAFDLLGLQSLTGAAGNDMLIGHDGMDRLEGGSGNDIVSGGGGIDVLVGGEGNDLFRDTAVNLSGDTIADLSVGDTIQITDASLAGFAFALSGSTLTYTGGSLTLQNVPFSFHLEAAAMAGGGVELALVQNPHSPLSSDFNGDGRDDLLWRSDSGQMSDWLGNANGGFVQNDAHAFAGVPTDWKIAGTADFDGDGRFDVLWRNSVTGQLSDWLGKADGGFTPNDANAQTAAPIAWQVAGTGDFNGDGRDDILWRNTATGQMSDWLGQANGGFAGNDPNALASVSLDWKIAGTGDFNGDGRDDILWRNATTGQLSDWLGQANGGLVSNDTNALTSVPLDWQIAGTGDFNGDGRDDILWRNIVTGQLSDWLGTANSGFVGNDANALTQVTTAWQVAGTGDFNGDGRSDIAWRNIVTGAMSDWLGQANGGFASNDVNALVTGVPTSWHIQIADTAFA